MSNLYHVSDRNLRDKIMTEGLRGHELPNIWNHGHNQPKGNYMFQFVSDAIDYREAVVAKYSDNDGTLNQRCDIWRIDISGFCRFLILKTY